MTCSKLTFHYWKKKDRSQIIIVYMYPGLALLPADFVLFFFLVFAIDT